MTFKEQAIVDLPTFVNVDEFGQTSVIDGVSMACVLVDDETGGGRGQDGITTIKSTLYVRRSSFLELPEVRQRMVIDDEPATITRVDEQQEMLVIRLEWINS